jgi:hypothetical protein
MTTLITEAQPEPGSDFEYLSHQPIVIDGESAAHRDRPQNDFAAYRFNPTDIDDLARIVGSDFDVRAELLPVFESLNRRPAGAFQSVSDLYVSSATASGPSRRAIIALRNLFLDAVDRRLQTLYCRYFAAHPPPVQARHGRKVASLRAVDNDARDIVGAYDWHWLSDWLELDRIGENAASCLRRLSNLAFAVQRVNFRLTYHCNIACRHCYNNSGPHLKKQRIALEPMLAIIAQMPSIGVGHLNLTGGEPFLYPEDLAAMIAAGRASGLLGIRINTNGYWATTDERARQTLERLSRAGFMREHGDHLKISAGIYHQEFIPFDRVLTLARSYHAMFGRRLRIDFETASGDSEAARQVRDQINDAGLSERVRLVFRGVELLGRAQELQDIATHPIASACHAIDEIVFDPDGSARPCCGLNNENQGVIIGKLKAHTLQDLVKRMQNDPILQFLAKNPMRGIFQYLEKSENPNGYSGICHLCQDALGALGDKEPLQARLFGGQRFYPFWFAYSGNEVAAPGAAGVPSHRLD